MFVNLEFQNTPSFGQSVLVSFLSFSQVDLLLAGQQSAEAPEFQILQRFTPKWDDLKLDNIYCRLFGLHDTPFLMHKQNYLSSSGT